MGSRTAEACRKFGAVYAMFTGGAAVLAGRAMKKVLDVKWLDLGIPEYNVSNNRDVEANEQSINCQDCESVFKTKMGEVF